MKKLLLSISVIALVGMFASCTGNNPKDDAKKLTDKFCECAKIEDEAALKKCSDEFDAMNSEMEERYKDDTAAKAIFEKAFKDCPCINEMFENLFGDMGESVDDATDDLGNAVNDAIDDAVNGAVDDAVNDVMNELFN